MGATVITVVQDKGEGKLMQEFLKRFRWGCLEGHVGEHIKTAVDGPLDRDFAYSKPKRGEYALGFNYTGGNFQWHYTWSICAFIALKIGKMKIPSEYSPYLIYDDETFLVSDERREDADPEAMATYVENSSGFIQPDKFYELKGGEKEGTMDEFHRMTMDFYDALRKDLKRAEKAWSNLIRIYHLKINFDLRFENIMACNGELCFLEAKAGLSGLTRDLDQIMERMTYKDLELPGE